MSNRTRCKMMLEGVFAQSWGGVKAIFRCQYDEKKSPEDRTFSKATPVGHAEFIIDNEAVFPMLVVGKQYYFDIIPIEENAQKNTLAAD